MKIIKEYIKRIKGYLFNRVAGRKKFQSFFEWMYQISLSGMNFGYFDIKINGEKNIINYLTSFTDNNTIPTVFDVGASIGDYSSSVISVLDNKVKLYCFEPSKKAFSLLKERFCNNKNIKMYNFGFSNEKKTAILYSDEAGSPTSSLFSRFGDKQFKNYGEEIEVRRLEDFCEENKINHIHLLKIDVEGNELNVLEGAKKLINSSAIDLIQFEFSKFDINSKVYFRDFFYFLNPNYKIHRILRDGLELIEEYNERYEIFVVINYLAVSRKL